MGCDLSGSFSYHIEFYSFMFMQKISTRVVCVNGKHPNIAYFSSFPGVALLPFARVMHSSHTALHSPFSAIQ